MAGIDLALDVARDIADAVDVSDRGSAELHHKASHEPNYALDMPRADAIAPAGMSSPDRREIARIHTGGVYDPQYSEAPALGAFFRVGGRVEINDKALLCGGTYQLAAPWRLSVSP